MDTVTLYRRYGQTVHHPYLTCSVKSVTGTVLWSMCTVLPFLMPRQTSHLGLSFFLGHGVQLLQYKADINAVNEHGNVPLHYACFWGQDQVAEVSTQTPNPRMSGKQIEHGTINPSVSPTV